MTVFKSTNSSIMAGNKADSWTDGKSSSSRHLKRSKTISVACIVDAPSRIKNEDLGSPSDDRSEDKLTKLVPQPALSFQALKYAVSALTRIDDFTLEELGGGFFANVYKATHKVTGQEMVMKINKDSANRASSLREVQLMNRMCHPNILRFLGVCVHEGQLHALTEYISGGTLEELLTKSDEELSWMLRIKLSLDIAQGMHYLHSEGVFHRDLTSRNVLIKKREHKNYQAVIADFGLATKIPDPEVEEPLPPVGCPWWMAPEVIYGKFYNQRADLFSYGIILLEMTARIEADPETMPRTKKFGVDYIKVCEMVDYCPLDFLHLAFKCCQIEAEKRPSSDVIVRTLEKIYQILHADMVASSEKQYKRSRSEDNIFQSSGSSTFTETMGEVLMTPHIVAQAMTKDDPHYCPASANPFADMSRFKDGAKVRELPRQKRSSKLGDSLTSSQISGSWAEEQESLSLPSSPIMLRKAAEKLHLTSLLGSSHAGQEVVQHELTISVSSDNQENTDTSRTVDKWSRFGGNRTRSLGSLDFWNPKFGLSAFIKNRRDNCSMCPHQSEKLEYDNEFNNESNQGMGETIAEDCHVSSSEDLNNNDDAGHSETDSNINCSLTSYTYHSFAHEEDDGGMVDSDSLSSSSLSSFASCEDIHEGEGLTEIMFNSFIPLQLEAGTRWQLSKRESLLVNDMGKPPIALESGSYCYNHFSQ